MYDSLVSSSSVFDTLIISTSKEDICGHVISIDTYPQDWLSGVISVRHDDGIGRLSLFDDYILYVHLAENDDGDLAKGYQIKSTDGISVEKE